MQIFILLIRFYKKNKVYSIEKEAIYSLSTFSASGYTVLFIINAQDGSSVHYPLKLNTSIDKVSGIIFLNNWIYFVASKNGLSYLIIIDSAFYTSIVYNFSSLTINRIGVAFDSSR